MNDPGPEPSCCQRCVSLIITLGFTSLFMWLSLRVSAPTCSIEAFDAFALDKSVSSSSSTNNHLSINQTIYYDLKLMNTNNEKGVYYDALNLTFYYKKTNNITLLVVLVPVGNATFEHFYQGHDKSTHRVGNIDTRGVKWENVTGSGNGSPVVFRVELATAVRYKIIFWKTKRHRLVVGGELQVDDHGSLVKGKKNKGVKLRSGAAKIKGCFGVWGILGILVLFYFW